MSLVGIGDNAGNRASISANALQCVDLAHFSNFTVSVSTNTINNGPGVLYGYIPTTAGTINFSVNGSPIGALSGAAGSIQTLPAPLLFNSLSTSASLGVFTIFWRALP